MATVEHCIVCFEALSASLSHRTALTLPEVQASWARYQKSLEDCDSADDEDEPKPNKPPRNPTLERLQSGSSTPGSSSSSSSSLNASTAATTPASSTETFAPPAPAPLKHERAELDESPLFVTWNTVSPRTGAHSLRGCIGTFETLPLATGLSSYALTSALSDHRFSPITSAELPALSVSVTLLTDFEPAADALDWELGAHGIRISFSAKGKRYGACYLPDVATEQGWDREETVLSLMRKAGWGGSRGKWREVGDFKTVRFRGMVETAGWAEFEGWREWVEKN